MPTLAEWGQFGDLVGGGSTLVGLGFAFLTVERWRKEKLGDRRSQAAGAALSSVLTVRSAIIRWAVGFGLPMAAFANDAPDAVLQLAKEAKQSGRPAVDVEVNRLAGTLREGGPYLTQAELQAAREIETVFRLYSMRITSLLLLARGDPAETLGKLESLSKEFLAKAEEAEKDAHATLGPVARLEYRTVWQRMRDAVDAWQKKQQERGIL